MEKVTKISFMRELRDFDSAMILSVVDKNLADIINGLNDDEVCFNRSATFSGSDVVFTFLNGSEVVESHLSLTGVEVYRVNDFRIVVDKYDSVEYILVYKISDNKNLDFKNLKMLQDDRKKDKIALDLKKEQETKAEKLIKYFSHRYFDKNKIAALTPLHLGRVKKSLEKQYLYDGVVMSVKENIESIKIQNKKVTDKMCNWNRRHYSKLANLAEQDEYEARLRAGKLYNICFDDSYSLEIPKSVYDILVDDFIMRDLKKEFKDGVTITKDNIAEYYDFMSDEDLRAHKKIISRVLGKRKDIIPSYFKDISLRGCGKWVGIDGSGDSENNPIEDLDITWGSCILKQFVFGVKDTLKPLDEYVAEIEGSNEYKKYIAISS